MGNVWLALLTGLTTGGISCLAVQGGLLSTTLADNKNNNLKILAFLIAKLIAYTLLGALLGMVGASLLISPQIQGFLQIAVGIFMILTALRLLDVHPIFRHFVIQPPKFAYRFLRKFSRNESLAAPAMLGAFTILIPCGVTQAMMILAVGTGNALWGALVMAAFTLGTSPVFFALGAAASQILKQPKLAFIAASFIFVLGIAAINTGQILRGSPHTLGNYYKILAGAANSQSTSSIAEIKDGKQEVLVNVTSNGYKPLAGTVKAGVPIRLILNSQNVRSCARAFVVPEFNISKILPQNGTEIIEFTPTRTGTITLTCSMGMYTSQLTVI